MSGVLGGCSFINLVIFEEIAKLPEETVPTVDSFYKLTSGKQFQPNFQIRGQSFYQSRLLQWYNNLNSPKKIFMNTYILFAGTGFGQYRHGRSMEEDLQWLKEWEEAADKEGIY